MCRLLEVSRAAFYEWLKQPVSNRVQEDEALFKEILKIFEESRQTYGSHRIHAELQGQYSRKRIARLMREGGLVAKKGRRCRPHWRKSKDDNIKFAKNLLNREFDVKEVNRAWVGDIKQIWTAEGWLYLAAVLDLFSRRVVGWAMSPRMESDLVVQALVMAKARRKTTGDLLFHSDRGSQYTSKDYQDLLKSYGIVCSMSRKGNCWDNAVMESFFSSLDDELLWGRDITDYHTTRTEVFEYIEVFYNRKRRHSTLGYLSPEQFEMASTV